MFIVVIGVIAGDVAVGIVGVDDSAPRPVGSWGNGGVAIDNWLETVFVSINQLRSILRWPILNPRSLRLSLVNSLMFLSSIPSSRIEQ